VIKSATALSGGLCKPVNSLDIINCDTDTLPVKAPEVALPFGASMFGGQLAPPDRFASVNGNAQSFLVAYTQSVLSCGIVARCRNVILSNRLRKIHLDGDTFAVTVPETAKSFCQFAISSYTIATKRRSAVNVGANAKLIAFSEFYTGLQVAAVGRILKKTKGPRSILPASFGPIQSLTTLGILFLGTLHPVENPCQHTLEHRFVWHPHDSFRVVGTCDT
jgi:hypothetical protein